MGQLQLGPNQLYQDSKCSCQYNHSKYYNPLLHPNSRSWFNSHNNNSLYSNLCWCQLDSNNLGSSNRYNNRFLCNNLCKWFSNNHKFHSNGYFKNPLFNLCGHNLFNRTMLPITSLSRIETI